ncbi:MAG: hypothetical protein ACI965_001496 [Paraglaciecola sp.]|jgi:hypothetical protein
MSLQIYTQVTLANIIKMQMDGAGFKLVGMNRSLIASKESLNKLPVIIKNSVKHKSYDGAKYTARVFSTCMSNGYKTRIGN